MKKKKFTLPFVLLEEGGPIDPGEGPGVAIGTGQSTVDVEPFDWEMWSVMFDEDDSDGDGTPGTWGDYVAWMTNNGFGDLIDYSQAPEEP